MSARAPLYNLDAARGESQLRRMRELEAQGRCIFCLEHAAELQREPVEHIGEHWYLTRNDFPYEGAEAHYLIVARRHVTAFEELPDEAGEELWRIRRELRERLQVPALSTVERSGDMHLNGGSVAHLHVHVVALGEHPSATVRFRVSAHGADEQS
jgi:diadenosine tetraphosphate (Ap4A) HIT family hydrolase